MEQIAQREKRDTEDYACQIKIMADAVHLPPMHKREQLKCFRDMRKNHHDEASCAKQLRTDPTLLVLENKMIEPKNSQDGTSATKDLINVALIPTSIVINERYQRLKRPLSDALRPER